MIKNREKVIEILKIALREKFRNYAPESNSMPFHTRLLGKDRLALYSFIHSLITNFGTSIFEPVAIVLSEDRFKTIKTHQKIGGYISSETQKTIQRIMDQLITAEILPNKPKEIDEIKKVCKTGESIKVKPTLADIVLESFEDEIIFIDMKTVKPNRGNFKEFKRTLLEWVGVALNENPQRKVQSMLAIPYNPYEPESYNRWTMRGMIDLDYELKVAKEFWDFVGGDGAYEDLLICFEKVGVEMREEIDEYFSKFNRD